MPQSSQRPTFSGGMLSASIDYDGNVEIEANEEYVLPLDEILALLAWLIEHEVVGVVLNEG